MFDHIVISSQVQPNIVGLIGGVEHHRIGLLMRDRHALGIIQIRGNPIGRGRT